MALCFDLIKSYGSHDWSLLNSQVFFTIMLCIHPVKELIPQVVPLSHMPFLKRDTLFKATTAVLHNLVLILFKFYKKL